VIILLKEILRRNLVILLVLLLRKERGRICQEEDNHAEYVEESVHYDI
jgi:hypothetical protein